MYMVGAHILATLTGNPYTSFVQSRIFDPLNMSSSTYSLTAASARIDQAGKSDLSETWTTFGRRIPFWFREEDVQLNAGYAGVISNVQDLVRPAFCEPAPVWLADGSMRLIRYRRNMFAHS